MWEKEGEGEHMRSEVMNGRSGTVNCFIHLSFDTICILHKIRSHFPWPRAGFFLPR